ncbi:MAG: DUF456 domain-containing protein [Nocardioides sp.]|uniref:DUF456 domain-containing protein n=1 Tax=Nocardioides sp. TaxID=35761 RepID=UPI0039E49FC7
MDDTTALILAAALVALGLFGILVPVIPGGSLLVGAGFLVWAWQGGHWAWFALLATILVIGVVLKWVFPQRRLSAYGIPVWTQLAGAAAAVVGFFVVPVIGLFLGFAVGIFAAESLRLGPRLSAGSTWAAIKAALLSIAIELAAALLASVVWIVGVIA